MNMNAELERILLPNGRDDMYITNWRERPMIAFTKHPGIE